MQGLVGKKIGMTQVFENGKLVPVTVIQAGPNYVLQKKSAEKEQKDETVNDKVKARQSAKASTKKATTKKTVTSKSKKK